MTVPKVPHPWMKLNGPLFPSKPRTADLSLLPSEGAGSSGEGSGAPEQCPAAPGREGLVR